MKTGNAFRYQSCHGQIGAVAEHGGELIYRQCGGGSEKGEDESAVCSDLRRVEYYSEHALTDAIAYISQFYGLTEATYSDDMTLVAGATMTANAVASNFRSAFAAFNLIKEVVA